MSDRKITKIVITSLTTLLIIVLGSLALVFIPHYLGVFCGSFINLGIAKNVLGYWFIGLLFGVISVLVGTLLAACVILIYEEVGEKVNKEFEIRDLQKVEKVTKEEIKKEKEHLDGALSYPPKTMEGALSMCKGIKECRE